MWTVVSCERTRHFVLATEGGDCGQGRLLCIWVRQAVLSGIEDDGGKRSPKSTEDGTYAAVEDSEEGPVGGELIDLRSGQRKEVKVVRRGKTAPLGKAVGSNHGEEWLDGKRETVGRAACHLELCVVETATSGLLDTYMSFVEANVETNEVWRRVAKLVGDTFVEETLDSRNLGGPDAAAQSSARTARGEESVCCRISDGPTILVLVGRRLEVWHTGRDECSWQGAIASHEVDRLLGDDLIVATVNDEVCICSVSARVLGAELEASIRPVVSDFTDPPAKSAMCAIRCRDASIIVAFRCGRICLYSPRAPRSILLPVASTPRALGLGDDVLVVAHLSGLDIVPVGATAILGPATRVDTAQFDGQAVGCVLVESVDYRGLIHLVQRTGRRSVSLHSGTHPFARHFASKANSRDNQLFSVENSLAERLRLGIEEVTSAALAFDTKEKLRKRVVQRLVACSRAHLRAEEEPPFSYIPDGLYQLTGTTRKPRAESTFAEARNERDLPDRPTVVVHDFGCSLDAERLSVWVQVSSAVDLECVSLSLLGAAGEVRTWERNVRADGSDRKTESRTTLTALVLGDRGDCLSSPVSLYVSGRQPPFEQHLTWISLAAGESCRFRGCPDPQRVSRAFSATGDISLLETRLKALARWDVTAKLLSSSGDEFTTHAHARLELEAPRQTLDLVTAQVLSYRDVKVHRAPDHELPLRILIQLYREQSAADEADVDDAIAELMSTTQDIH